MPTGGHTQGTGREGWVNLSPSFLAAAHLALWAAAILALPSALMRCVLGKGVALVKGTGTCHLPACLGASGGQQLQSDPGQLSSVASQGCLKERDIFSACHRGAIVIQDAQMLPRGPVAGS
jgi:hypothetical protein